MILLLSVITDPIFRRTIANQELAHVCHYQKEKETGGENEDFTPVSATARRET